MGVAVHIRNRDLYDVLYAGFAGSSADSYPTFNSLVMSAVIVSSRKNIKNIIPSLEFEHTHLSLKPDRTPRRHIQPVPVRPQHHFTISPSSSPLNPLETQQQQTQRRTRNTRPKSSPTSPILRSNRDTRLRKPVCLIFKDSASRGESNSTAPFGCRVHPLALLPKPLDHPGVAR